MGGLCMLLGFAFNAENGGLEKWTKKAIPKCQRKIHFHFKGVRRFPRIVRQRMPKRSFGFDSS